MKRKINIKNRLFNKNLVVGIITTMFLFFICTCLALSSRNYIFIENGFKKISSSISALFINHFYSNNYLKENITSSKITYLQKENNSLKNMLNLKENNENYIISEVINHTSRIWFNTLELSKGYDDGINKGMPVITEKGLVGFIGKTSKNISEVKLLTNITESDMISVLIENENEFLTGILKGYDVNKKMFKITDCLSKNTIKQGSRVILSGYGNAAFKGIYIGAVVDDEVSNHGLSKTIWVKTDVNFDDILFVAVLKVMK